MRMQRSLYRTVLEMHSTQSIECLTITMEKGTTKREHFFFTANQIESNGVNVHDVDNYFNLIGPKCAMIEFNLCVSFQSIKSIDL